MREERAKREQEQSQTNQDNSEKFGQQIKQKEQIKVEEKRLNKIEKGFIREKEGDRSPMGFVFSELPYELIILAMFSVVFFFITAFLMTVIYELTYLMSSINMLNISPGNFLIETIKPSIKNGFPFYNLSDNDYLTWLIICYAFLITSYIISLADHYRLIKPYLLDRVRNVYFYIVTPLACFIIFESNYIILITFGLLIGYIIKVYTRIILSGISSNHV